MNINGTDILTVSNPIQNDSLTLTGNLVTQLNTESATYTENSIKGELLKIKNQSTYYAGIGAANSITTATQNLLVGENAGSQITSQFFNVGYGPNVLRYSNGDNNVAIGVNSQKGILGGLNNGVRNVSLGGGSLAAGQTTTRNVALGHFAGGNMTSGSDNVMVGYQVSDSALDDAAQQSIIIGARSNSNGGINRCVIAVDVNATKNNQIILGNASVTDIINNGNGVCDLGSITNLFKNLYLAGDVIANNVSVNAIKINNDWSILDDNNTLTVVHSTAGVVDNKIVIGNPPTVANVGVSLSNIDYSNMLPNDMRADITSNGGGINKCWGDTATYLSGTDLLAGRVVSLQDTATGSDNSTYLVVRYLITDSETFPSIFPIGVTQHNSLAGEKINVCILGYTTCICGNADNSPERGSEIVCFSNLGKIKSGVNGGGNESRIGFIAQSDPIAIDTKCLIYFKGSYQSF